VTLQVVVRRRMLPRLKALQRFLQSDIIRCEDSGIALFILVSLCSVHCVPS